MSDLELSLAGTWMVVLITGTFWGGGFWLQRNYQTRRILRDTIRCRGRVCRILGVRAGEDRLHIRPAIAQVFGILYLVAGLFEAWCYRTFYTLAVLGNVFLLAIMVWGLFGSWILGRGGD